MAEALPISRFPSSSPSLRQVPAPAGFLTPQLAEEAIRRVLPMLEAAADDRTMCGTGFLSVVIVDPAHRPQDGAFDDAVLYEHHVGDTRQWDADYGAFARAKAKLAWRTGQDSRHVQAEPHLLQQGDTLLAGAVHRHGIVVGVSGAHPWYDEACATAVAAMLRALAWREHEALRAAGVHTWQGPQ